MEKSFAQAYKGLNPAQKKAVDAIEGPVLVVAGPGTGKTQLLSVRVANILKTTDTDPGSILCLTFTNFAATNMRARLNQLIGPSAHNVVVRTFHSFAAEIMNLYPDYFWNGARLSIAPDAVQLEIVQTILSQLPLDNPLAVKFAGTFTALGDVQQALKLTKEAGLNPAKLQAMLTVNAAYLDVIEPLLVEILSPTLGLKKLPDLQATIDALPDQGITEAVKPLASLSTVIKTSLTPAIAEDMISGKTTQTGKWKRRWLQTEAGQKGVFDERRRAAWWQALVGVYEQYREQLHAHGYYDYSDMVIEVIGQLEQHAELLAGVQERFLYVLIDEFQDTNAAQLRLAHLVSSHYSNADKPNLMAVGDDDQSIFAFNGAELNNMLTFSRTYPTTKTIVLSKNYRSSQAILDYAQTVIEQADDRLVKRQPDLTKKLIADKDYQAGTIEQRVYQTREHQLSIVAAAVQQTWHTNPTQTVAVLARSHDSLRRLSACLSQLQVPIRYEQQNDVLDLELVQQILLLAETVCAIGNGDQAAVNQCLGQLLRHPAWRVNPEILWQLATTNYRQPQWLDSLLKHSEPALVALGEWLLWLAQTAAHEPLPVMLEYLLGLRAAVHMTSPLHDYFINLRVIDNAYLTALSGLQVLRSLSNEFAVGSDAADLTDFVRFIHLNKDLGRSITDQSWFVSGERAVQLMTVHKAKGLEFDTVFLLDAIEDTWQPRHAARKPPANLPLQPYGEHFDDYVRLAYVAATRAKHSFVVSSYANDMQGRALLPTPLFTALPSVASAEEAAANSIAVLETALRWPRLETANEKALLASRLENYRLSATAFLQFLDVSNGGPERFLERQLLRLPEITTPTMAYGTAIHQALQTAQQLINQATFSVGAVLEAYSNTLQKQQLPRAELERYQPHGLQVLSHLFSDEGFTLGVDGQAEVTIAEVQLGKACLGGKLDHLQINGDSILITDYKTGKPLNSFTTKDQTKAIKAWRHSTQLLFYTLLVQGSGRFASFKNIRSQMMYVEAEDPKQRYLSLAPDPESLKQLEQLIAVVWQHIMDLNFPDTSTYSQDMVGITSFANDLIARKTLNS